MKKLISFITTVILVAGLYSCTNNNNNSTLESMDTQSLISNAETQSSQSNSEIYSQAETSDDEKDETIAMQEFFTTVKYMQLQDCAFQFISAYERADYNSAMEVVVDKDVLSSYFPSEKKSMDDMIVYHIVNVVLDSYEKDGKQIETASLVISVAFEDYAGSFDFVIDLDYVDYVYSIEGNEYTAKTWKVKSYYLDT